MKLFNTIMSKIFGRSSAPAPATGPAPSSPTASNTTATVSGAANPSSSATISGLPGVVGAGSAVDVNAVLNEMASKNSEQLDWKKSIVDLMKLVGMDSSLASRKELAKELGYSGDQSDSASMNIWLHKQVLRKLAENGGKVPANLLD